MKITSFKRLIVEDSKAENQELVSKLASILNPTLEQLERILTKNINTDNLAQSLVDISVTVDSSGVPVGTTTFKNDLQSKLRGIISVRAQSSNPNLSATGTPLITFSENANLITINNITGLQANTKYTLTLLTIT